VGLRMALKSLRKAGGGKEAGNAGDMVFRELLALGAEGFPHLLVAVHGVDELDVALAVGGFVVGEDPDVGGDAGVVEHVRGQRDDSLDKVILEQVATDFRLAGARAAGEERRAIEDDPDARAALHGAVLALFQRPHLGDEVEQEQQRAVRDARQAGTEAAGVAFLRILVVLDEDQRGGEAHDVAGREVLAGGFVGGLGEFPDEFLEDETHVIVVDGLGREVPRGEALDDK
jgi:hypothetical protein